MTTPNDTTTSHPVELIGARVFLAPCNGTCGSKSHHPHAVLVHQSSFRCLDCPAGVQGIFCRHCRMTRDKVRSEVEPTSEAELEAKLNRLYEVAL